MSESIFDCTQPSEGYNPKRAKDYTTAYRSGAFGSVANPIEEEMKDIEQVRKTYAQLPLISFFDNSDATLRFLRNLKEFSPTHGACISEIGRYVLGGEIEVTRHKEEGLYQKDFDTEASTSENLAMVNFVKSLNPNMERRAFVQLLDIAKGVYQNRKTYGNAFIRINMVTVGSSKFVYIENIDAEKCRYWATLPNEPKVIAISTLWNYDYVLRNPPDLIGVYPNMTELDNGMVSTIIHDHNKSVGRDWYGLPDAMNSLYWQYAEMQQGKYFTEGFASDFAGRVLMEYVGEAESDQTDFEDAITDTFTNKAGTDKKRIITRMRLPEDTPITVHEFGANTEHEFHKGISELCENEIIKSHSWNKILIGVPIAGKLGTSTEFLDIYKIKNTALISPLRHQTMQSINTALSIAEEFMTGKTTINDTVSLGLRDLYKDMITQQAEAAKAAMQVQSQNSNNNQQASSKDTKIKTN